MFCGKCGAKVPDDSKFCPVCGEKMNVVQSGSNSSETNKGPTLTEAPSSYEPRSSASSSSSFTGLLQKLTNKQKITYGAVVVGIVVVAILLFTFVLGPKRISIEDFLNVEFYGYDGLGSASVYVNEESEFVMDLENIENEFDDKCIFADESKKCQELYQKYQNLETFGYSLDYDINADDGNLSNGDTVHVAITYDKDALEQLGYKFNKDSVDIKVKNLVEPEKIDLFKDMTVEWQNVYGDFEAVVSNGPLDAYYYSVEEKDDQTVVVSVNKTSVINDYGLASETGEYSKEFKLDTKPELITNVTSENEDTIKDMAKGVLYDTYLAKCGWNLYDGKGGHLIDSAEASYVYNDWYGNIKVDFKIKSSEGKEYYRTIEMTVIKDSDGTLKNIMNYDADNIGCELSGKYWY